MIDRMSIGWIRRNQMLETIEINFNAVAFLRSCRAEVGERGKTLPVAGCRLIQPLSRLRPEPCKLLVDRLVRPKSVVVRAERIGSIGPSHDAAAGSVATQEQIIPPVHVR